MPNQNTDRNGFSTENADKQRDDAAKGGSVTGPGNPTSKHGIVSSYDMDTQTQLAAKAAKKKNNKNKG